MQQLHVNNIVWTTWWWISTCTSFIWMLPATIMYMLPHGKKNLWKKCKRKRKRTFRNVSMKNMLHGYICTNTCSKLQNVQIRNYILCFPLFYDYWVSKLVLIWARHEQGLVSHKVLYKTQSCHCSLRNYQLPICICTLALIWFLHNTRCVVGHPVTSTKFTLLDLITKSHVYWYGQAF